MSRFIASVSKKSYISPYRFWQWIALFSYSVRHIMDVEIQVSIQAANIIVDST